MGESTEQDLKYQNANLRVSNRNLRWGIAILAVLAALTTVSSTAAILLAVRLQHHHDHVVVVATGEEHHVQLRDDGSNKACVDEDELGRIWNSTMSGTPTTIALHNNSTILGFQLQASGSVWNETHLCFHVTDGSRIICAEFDETCDVEAQRHLAHQEERKLPHYTTLRGHSLHFNF